MNNEEMIPTAEEVSKLLEKIPVRESKECDSKHTAVSWQEQEKRLRKRYLEHPDRKEYFEYDFVEVLWFHMLEYYGVAVGDKEIEEMVITVMEDHRLWEMIYDAVQKVADRNGWKMII